MECEPKGNGSSISHGRPSSTQERRAARGYVSVPREFFVWVVFTLPETNSP